MKAKRVSAGEVLTMQLLKQLNNNAWTVLMVKGQFSVIQEKSKLNKTVIAIPLIGLKNWTTEKFMYVFNKTMNAAYYEIKFI
jgi:hypothetical protein